MTNESKQAVLDAYDALEKVGMGYRIEHPETVAHKGGTSGFCCDYCDTGIWENPMHKPNCVIGKALDALVTIIPPYTDRQAWLDDKNQPPPIPQ
jgi:hypothetical protein